MRHAVPSAKIIPFLVCWGPGVRPTSDGRVVRAGDVRVVSGVQADQWRPLLSTERLSANQITELAEEVRRWIAKHEDWRASQPEEARRTSALARNTRRLAAAATVTSVISSGTLLLAALSESFNREAGSAFRTAGGVPTIAMILGPLGLGLLSVALWWRMRSRLESAAARRHLPSKLVGTGAVASLLIWPLVLGAVVITRQG